MISIILTNEKGGEGKTTTSVHISAGLALRDKRVLLIDGSAQGHCAHHLAMEPFGGVYRLLVQGAAWNDVLREAPMANWCGRKATIGSLHVLQGNGETAAIPMLIRDPLLLRKRLEEVVDRFDVVVIDTAPEPSMLQPIFFFAADKMILPTKCAELSLEGIKDTTTHTKEHDAMRIGLRMKPLKLIGVLPTMYRDTVSHSIGREFLEINFGIKRIWSSIPLRTIWEECQWEHKTLFAYAPNHVATEEINVIVDKVEHYAS